MDRKTRELYRLKAELIQAAAHPLRLAVIDCLRGGERCVGDIAKAVGAERSNVSRHLALMVQAGLLKSRKDGLNVIYSLRTPCILKFLGCVTDVLRERLKSSQAMLERL